VSNRQLCIKSHALKTQKDPLSVRAELTFSRLTHLLRRLRQWPNDQLRPGIFCRQAMQPIHAHPGGAKRNHGIVVRKKSLNDLAFVLKALRAAVFDQDRVTLAIVFDHRVGLMSLDAALLDQSSPTDPASGRSSISHPQPDLVEDPDSGEGSRTRRRIVAAPTST